jgi:hypothetical protein
MLNASRRISARNIAAAALIAMGVLVFGLCGREILKPGRIDRSWLASRALLGVIPLGTGGVLWMTGRGKGHLRSVFFQMLKSGTHEMTVLQFAMAAGIDGGEAKDYLDYCAREYDATFGVGTEGQVLYCFGSALPEGK